MASPSRPNITRKSSRVPGGFETDDDLSPIKTSFDDDYFGQLGLSPHSSEMQVNKSDEDDISLHNGPSEEEGSMVQSESDTFLQEKEMRKRLDDMDSTFLQEVSPATHRSAPPEEDSAVTGPTPEPSITSGAESHLGVEQSVSPRRSHTGEDSPPRSPPTPPGMYHTPAPGRAEPSTYDEEDTTYGDGHANTSSLETMSSSPTAAAAARTVSRVVSTGSANTFETADDSKGGIMLDQEMTPRNEKTESIQGGDSPTPTKHGGPFLDSNRPHVEVNEEASITSPQSSQRPKYLNSRMASQRSSYSSYTTVSTDAASDATLGADFALQSGGAVPQGSLLSSRPGDFSRSISLGSMASGISDLDEGDEKLRLSNGLHTLEEEDDTAREDRLKASGNAMTPRTPRSRKENMGTPTDTVIAQHVKDVHVPSTLAREYSSRQRPQSPDKRSTAPSAAGRHGKNLTLKEQSSTIDRLVKENFDLKLKITFLDEALNRRSDEGIKAMISENVDLRTAKFKSAKETRELKRSIRDLERRLTEKSAELAEKRRDTARDEAGPAPDLEAFQDLEEEVAYLRERVTTYDFEIEKIRNENLVQENEKKKLAEMIRMVGDANRSSDVGAREEVDLWKDLLEAETARREQADEDNRRLREEIRRLKSDTASTTTNNHATNVYHVSRRQKLASTLSYTGESDRAFDPNGASSAVSSTLVEQLRHENAEMRKEVAAQTSMLQSRNRERERLQLEIEDLKLGGRRADGTRSIAGDSIFERSASRALGRPASRGSDQTRVTQMSDPERDALEFKNGQLRDQNAKLRLEIQDLAKQTEELLDELEQLDGLKIDHEKLQELYDNDISMATEDLQNLQRERDDALRAQEDMEVELQDLKAEGSERIGALEEELDQRNQDLENLQNELSNQAENAEALRREVRTLSENVIRIEEESEAKSKRIRGLQLELEELTHEADAMDKDVREEKEKASKLTVQQQSSQSEIAFLREEQDGDKMKIGDLEDALSNLKISLSSERDRAKDLENRVAEERHQREAIGSKEKQEVQKMMNDLNREASSAKDECRKLGKNLQSREIEANTYKDRLNELESNLREVLGDSNGTRSTFLVAITRIQKELENTLSELETAQHNLSEKDRLLKNRDALLESHGLESKKLSDILERERQGRRADKLQHEQWQKSHQHTSRTVTQKDSRIVELDNSRQADRKRFSTLEAQFKDQLSERNTLLLTLWGRVSAICGQDWQRQNSLINNHLPTLDVVANAAMFPTFSKTLLAAVKNVETIIFGFQSRLKSLDRELWTEYQSVESTLDARIKKLDRLESTVQSHRISGTFTAAPEIAKLRGENRLLKSELATIQKKLDVRLHSTRSSTTTTTTGSSRGAHPLPRHNSSSAVEHLRVGDTTQVQPQQHLGIGPPISPSRRTSSSTFSQLPLATQESSGGPIDPSQQRWIHRLRELERRLKAEREGRLLDRVGARKRLEEGVEENLRLKGELERERVRRGGKGEGGKEGEGEGAGE